METYRWLKDLVLLFISVTLVILFLSYWGLGAEAWPSADPCWQFEPREKKVGLMKEVVQGRSQRSDETDFNYLL